MTAPTFFLLVDAIPHNLAREVWAAGGLTGFAEPRPAVSVFPSLTGVAVPALLRGIFETVPPGYEVRYYDPTSGEIRGSFGDPVSEAAMAPFRARPHGFVGHTAMYLLRRGLAYAQIRWITHRFQEEGGPWLGYLSATDGVAHFSGRAGLERSLRDVAAALDAVRREHEQRHGVLPGVVLCSDHGMHFGEVEHLSAHELEARLTDAGFHAGDSGPDGVTLVPFGEVGAGVVHTAAERAADVAEVVARAPGVDLAFAHGDGGCLVLGVRDTLQRARVRWREGFYRYECVDGDPLGYAPVWRALADAGKLRDGWAPDRELFLATWRHAYPDALARLRRGLEDLVRHPATVLFSMQDSWTFGPALTHVGAAVMGGIVGTHGALSADQSLGFAAVTENGADPWPDTPALRTEEVLRPWRDLVRAGESAGRVKILVVANPVAGAGRGRREAERLVPLLEERGHAVELVLTAGPGDARRCLAARARAEPLDRIVVVGGDGTLNEVVNGLPDPGAVPLAQLAVGTANMLARELGLPRDAETAAELLESGGLRRIDLGRANGRRFLMNVSCGFDAMVTESVRSRRSGTLGFHAYLLPILQTLWRYREPRLTVRLDGGTAHSAGLVIVSNLRNYGGLFAVTERARCDSGDLAVCLFRRARLPDLFRYVLAGFLRRLSRLRSVAVATAARIDVESHPPVAVQIDGDYAGTTPLTIEVEPARVRIVAPAIPSQ